MDLTKQQNKLKQFDQGARYNNMGSRNNMQESPP